MKHACLLSDVRPVAAEGPVCTTKDDQGDGGDREKGPEVSPGGESGPDRGSSTAVKKRPSRPRADWLPPYKVLLHNDDVNEMLYVVESIATLTPHDRASATKLMIEAHTSGVALLLTTHKERAELYEEQFRSKHLLVTVEPAD